MTYHISPYAIFLLQSFFLCVRFDPIYFIIDHSCQRRRRRWVYDYVRYWSFDSFFCLGAFSWPIKLWHNDDDDDVAADKKGDINRNMVPLSPTGSQVPSHSNCIQPGSAINHKSPYAGKEESRPRWLL